MSRVRAPSPAPTRFVQQRAGPRHAEPRAQGFLRHAPVPGPPLIYCRVDLRGLPEPGACSIPARSTHVLEITEVTPESLAAEAGIKAGDRITAINGRPVKDFLDVHLWLGEEELELTLEHKNVYGEPFEVHIRREYGRTLGLTFDPPRIRRCANDCPFCFVDQLPPGSRASLRIRDDDYRFSYLYGHFITLTNLKESEFDRIIDNHLSPLYVSVHALDPDVREACLKTPRARDIRRHLERLLEGGIELHTQIVATPGLNDGPVLEETVFGLAEYFPGILSCSVVPVGLTGHREGLTDLRPYSQEEALAMVRRVERYGRALQERLGDPFVHAADEFVILAGLPIPEPEYYGDFSQVENGVGLVRQWLMQLEGGEGRQKELNTRGIKRLLIVTGESFGPVLQEHTRLLQAKVPDLSVEIIPAENKLFGRPVTVAGLLGATDILRETEGRVRPGDLVLIPNECLNPEGLFLDDMTLPDVQSRLGVPVEAHWDSVFTPAETTVRGELVS